MTRENKGLALTCLAAGSVGTLVVAWMRAKSRKASMNASSNEEAPISKVLLEIDWDTILWSIAVPVSTTMHFAFQTKGYRLLGAMGKLAADANEPGLRACVKDFLKVALPLAVCSGLTSYTQVCLTRSLRRSLDRLVLKRLERPEQLARASQHEGSLAAMSSSTAALAETLSQCWGKWINGMVMFVVNIGYMVSLAGLGPVMRIFGVGLLSSGLVRILSPVLSRLRRSKERNEANMLLEASRIATKGEELALSKGSSGPLAGALDRLHSSSRVLDHASFLSECANNFIVRQVGTAYGVLQMLPLTKVSKNPMEDLTLAIHLLVNAGKGVFGVLGGMKLISQARGASSQLLEVLDAIDTPERERHGGLLFEDVQVSAGKDGELLFDVPDVKVDAAGDQRIFITGDNGCGKTSLLRLISGLTGADKAKQCRIPHWNQLACLSQHNLVLEERNILENLSVGSPEISLFARKRC